MTLVVLARYGETQLNAAGQFRGRIDPPLTREGERQARALANVLLERAPVALYVSPRLRARTTAAPATALLGLDPTITSALDDFDYGEWTGETDASVAKRWPELYADWRRDPTAIEFPGGEVVQGVVLRTVTFLREAHAHHPDATIAAVTHDAIIRCAVCAALGVPLVAFHRIAIDLASITGILVEGNAMRVAWVNDTAHVRAIRIGAHS
jgi:phosphoserine phosphatase